VALAQKTGNAKRETVNNSLKGANPKRENLAEDKKEREYDRLFIGSCYGSKAKKEG
jgi:hypothetical protein